MITHKKQNPMYTLFDEIAAIASTTTYSLATACAGFWPTRARGADHGVGVLGELTQARERRGMVEGPVTSRFTKSLNMQIE
jgi:hypothetical protein